MSEEDGFRLCSMSNDEEGWDDLIESLKKKLVSISEREKANESQFIDKIVKDVLGKLALRYPPEQEDEELVGIHEICEQVEILLSKSKQLQKNIQVTGIWGMGGSGKTTIAKALFSKFFPMYDGVCFMEHIRESSENSRPSKLTALRGELLYKLLHEENLNLNGVESAFIRERLRSKKVFIVLDDVDTETQLDELRKGLNYAAPGSKLIITTRDRGLLLGRVYEKYDVEEWRFNESLELFCLHAFKQRCPLKGYEDLSKKVVDYAGGLPLALRVLGSDLYSRSEKFWDCKLKKLKKYPVKGIQNVLQVTYDDLDFSQREIFLDIAFFFKDEEKDFVERILNACGFFATSGIEILDEKALITILKSKRIKMHDLLQEMGMNIVCKGIEDPGKRSRLRDIEDVYDVLQNKKGSHAVKGIMLDLSHINNLLSLSADAFDMMTELRYLKLYIPFGKKSGKVEYPQFFNKISDKLRYLEWHEYCLKSLPATFSAKMLVEIRMPHSQVVELWQRVKDVVNLEGVDLSECKQLKNLPDLSTASKLKWVNLTGCVNLLAVHPSILSLDSLESLILDSCKRLKKLKSEKHLRSLMNLSINGCTSLEEFSISSDLIKSLDLSNTRVQKLHSSIGNLTRLESLNLEGLSLRNLPNEVSLLKSLRDLRISSCTLVMDKKKQRALFEGLTHLQILYLKGCKISELPDNISGLSHLHELRLDGSSVEQLPESIKFLQNLQILSLNNCGKLRCLPQLPESIRVFSAANCRSLMSLTTLKTFASVMIGKEKYISFENCLKLGQRPLHCIIEGTQYTMMKALFENKYDDRFRLKTNSSSYNLVKVCFPESRVPRQFTYQTTNSSFTITLPSKSKLLGIILSAVLSPSEELKKHGARIQCQCYLKDGKNVGQPSIWYHEAITELNSDHLYIWCDSFHFDSISEGSERQVSFKFSVTNDMEKPKVSNIHTKECGVHLVFDEKEENDIKNQAWVLSEKISQKTSRSSDCLSVVVIWVCCILLLSLSFLSFVHDV